MKIILNIFSGLFSEIDGPGPWADQTAKLITDALPQHTFIVVKKPYSVIREFGYLDPTDAASEFIQAAYNADWVVNIGHSFGGSAAKFVGDALNLAGLQGKNIGTFMFDGVPNGDRCGHDFGLNGTMWHAPGEYGMQIFQRAADILPRGLPIITDATHWNLDAAKDLGANVNHLTLPFNPTCQNYLSCMVISAIKILQTPIGNPGIAPAVTDSTGGHSMTSELLDRINALESRVAKLEAALRSGCDTQVYGPLPDAYIPPDTKDITRRINEALGIGNPTTSDSTRGA